jgi:hypothetical protein
LQDSPAPLRIPESEIIADSISYYFPNGYLIEYLPADVTITNEFGKYNYRLRVNGDQLTYLRYLELNKGDIPLEKFNIFRDFINSVAKTDRNNIVLTKAKS